MHNAINWDSETNKARATSFATRIDIVSGEKLSEEQYKGLPDFLRRKYIRRQRAASDKSISGKW